MVKEIVAWQMHSPNSPLVEARLPVPELGPDDVLIQVAGCGLCPHRFVISLRRRQDKDAATSDSGA